jgi:hypothetical protein
MRSDQCRIIVHDKDGRAVGCGFIADDMHVITCSHVVESAQNAPPEPGNCIRISTNTGEYLDVAVVKHGGAAFDVCVLKRCDAGRFAPTQSALWARGRPGQAFTGLGMNRDYPRGVPLHGTLGAYVMGSSSQFVSAMAKDNRIEQGASGAPLFEVVDPRVKSDGPLLGMVTDYQQLMSGVIASAEALAAFWPGLRSFDATPGEALPDLLADAADCVPVDRLLREIDRVPQRRAFKEAIDDGLLSEQGFLIASLPGVSADLPDRCATVLSVNGLARIMRNVAPDTIKTSICSIKFANLYSNTSKGATSNLLFHLCDKYLINTDAAALRTCLAQQTVPLSIIVTVSVVDLPRITATMLKAWAKCLGALALPEQNKPLMMFILVVGDEGDPAIAQAPLLGGARRRWFISLPPLALVGHDDVQTWMIELPPDAQGRRVRQQIDTILTTKAGARPSFRMKELESWFSAG